MNAPEFLRRRAHRFRDKAMSRPPGAYGVEILLEVARQLSYAADDLEADRDPDFDVACDQLPEGEER